MRSQGLRLVSLEHGECRLVISHTGLALLLVVKVVMLLLLCDRPLVLGLFKLTAGEQSLSFLRRIIRLEVFTLLDNLLV